MKIVLIVISLSSLSFVQDRSCPSHLIVANMIRVYTDTPHLFQFNLFVEILLMFSQMFDAQEPFTMVQALKDSCGVSV